MFRHAWRGARRSPQRLVVDEPGFELPADAGDERGRGEHALVTPAPLSCSPCSVSAPPRSACTTARAPRAARAGDRRDPSPRTRLRRHASRADRARVSNRVGGGLTAHTCSSRPDASRWARAPSGPNRVSTAYAGSRAKSPRVCRPSRTSRCAKSAPCSIIGASAVTGQPARNAADPPGSTTRGVSTARRAAKRAANAPSATPRCASVMPASAIAASTRAASPASLPAQRVTVHGSERERPGRSALMPRGDRPGRLSSRTRSAAVDRPRRRRGPRSGPAPRAGAAPRRRPRRAPRRTRRAPPARE